MFVTKASYNKSMLDQILYYLQENFANYTVLHSSYKTGYSGDKTLIAFDLITEVTDLADLTERIKQNTTLFGYFSYEAFTDLNQTHGWPKIKFQQYHNLITINHQNGEINYELSDKDLLSRIQQFNYTSPKNTTEYELDGKLTSNMTDAEYLQHVTTIKSDIIKGEYYQLNLTRKFNGKFKRDINPVTIFLNLAKEFPSPYSALIRHDSKYIISSSPERFINIEDGQVSSRPIKGTIPKIPNLNTADDLYNCEKNRAENLMIVDLMRNDLSLSAEFGSVKTGKLYEIDEFANLYHMSTNVLARKQKQLTNLDVIKAAFPPASMTGAPKQAVIKRITEIEQLPRGVYSGSIGYFAGEHYCDFNVVIRTILIDGRQFEYQVGGGITYASSPEQELEETLVKAAKIRKVLGLD